MQNERVNDKQTLREWAKETRSTLPMAELSRVLVRRLMETPEFRAAQSILLYLSMPGEVAIETVCGLLEAAGKQWFLPRCAPQRRIAVHPYQPGTTPLRAGPFGIREPNVSLVPEAEPIVLDLVVVPALLLSEHGERLGYGGGYYDRFLPRLRPDCARLGLLPDALLVASLPRDPWDQNLSILVTETRVLRV